MSEDIKKANTTEAAEVAEEATETPAGGANDSGNVIPLPTPEKAQEAPASGVYVHKFGKPFKSGDKTHSTLNFYFERLTGRDMIAIENEMQAMQEYALAPEISRSFQSKMAAKAGGIGSDVLESMPLNEFNRITNAARDFLISTGY